jgi:prepilin-type processing-associated H-X9-DG protein
MRDEPRPDGALTHYPLNYGINTGTWFLFDPAKQAGGDGLVFPNSRTSLRSVSDGSSRTLAFAEVKAYNAYFRDGGNPNAAGAPMPATPADVAPLGGNFKVDSGHTEWVDGRVHQTGFTATFAPNTVVPHTSGGKSYDVDFNSSREGLSTTKFTYAAVTSRSYHPDGVQVGFADGSVHFVAETIDILVWRALATREGGEILDEGQY